MSYGICPNCDNKVFIDMEPEIGFHLLCQTCQTPLVIVWLNPIELSLIDYEEYDIIDEGSTINKFQKSKKKEYIMATGKPKKSNKKSSSTTGKKKTRKK